MTSERPGAQDRALVTGVCQRFPMAQSRLCPRLRVPEKGMNARPAILNLLWRVGSAAEDRKGNGDKSKPNASSGSSLDGRALPPQLLGSSWFPGSPKLCAYFPALPSSECEPIFCDNCQQLLALDAAAACVSFPFSFPERRYEELPFGLTNVFKKD